jgi:hypothetical protein
MDDKKRRDEGMAQRRKVPAAYHAVKDASAIIAELGLLTG